VFLWWQGGRLIGQAFLLLTVLLWIMHRANVARLLRGDESKIGAGAQAVGDS
jgi:glycerol-3-phosphate acyltransferase PlsY